MHHKGIVEEPRQLMLGMLLRDDYRFDVLAQVVATDPELVLYLLKRANAKYDDRDMRPANIRSIIDAIGAGSIEQVVKDSTVISDEYGTKRAHMISRNGQAHLDALMSEHAFPGLVGVPKVYFLAGLMVDIIGYEYFVDVCHQDLIKALFSLGQGKLVLKHARDLQREFERGKKKDHPLHLGWDTVTKRVRGMLFPSVEQAETSLR